MSFSRDTKGCNELIAEILKVFISPVRISVFTTLKLCEKSHTSLDFCHTHCYFNECLFVKIILISEVIINFLYSVWNSVPVADATNFN